MHHHTWKRREGRPPCSVWQEVTQLAILTSEDVMVCISRHLGNIKKKKNVRTFRYSEFRLRIFPSFICYLCKILTWWEEATTVGESDGGKRWGKENSMKSTCRNWAYLQGKEAGIIILVLHLDFAVLTPVIIWAGTAELKISKHGVRLKERSIVEQPESPVAQQGCLISCEPSGYTRWSLRMACLFPPSMATEQAGRPQGKRT